MHFRVPAKQSLCAFRQPTLLEKVSTSPHHLPFDTSQVAVGVEIGDALVVVGIVGVEMGRLVELEVGVWTGREVVIAVETGTDVEVGVEDDEGKAEEVDDDSLKDRYQFERSVSPRHSPTVTPFQPFC